MDPGRDLLALPPDLPEPEDDGAADHLAGARLPAVTLPATNGPGVRLDELDGWSVVFGHPRIGRPGVAAPGGDENWDAIPGARGCTPQACAVRARLPAFAELGVRPFGLSSQSTEDQREAAERLHLPYPLLSDSDGLLAGALGLPRFVVAGVPLLRRITLMIRSGRIEDRLYPVFPPTRAADDALAWLRGRGSG